MGFGSTSNSQFIGSSSQAPLTPEQQAFLQTPQPNRQQNPPQNQQSQSSNSLSQTESQPKRGRVKRLAKKVKVPEPIGDVTLRWQPEEETLLAECFVAVSEDLNIGRPQPKDTLWFQVQSFKKSDEVDLMKRASGIYRDENKINAFNHEDAWSILRKHAKWDAPNPAPVDLTKDEDVRDEHVSAVNTDELFGPDARPCPPGKQRSGKKTKSNTSASIGGSSSSTQFGEFMSHELHLKQEAAEKVFDVSKEINRTITCLEEFRFLALSTKDLSDDDAYYINLRKAAIKEKLRLQMAPPSSNNNNDNNDEETDDDENHITHPHCEVLKAQKNQNSEAGQTFMARDGSVFRYDPDYLREQFAGLVIQRALPFNHFDHEQTTRVFQNTMQSRYTHVSRSTLKRDAMKLWLAAKQEIIDSFGNLDACVNLTTDVWSAPHGVPGSYMCVIAHWIEPDTWQMMKRVISFEEFPWKAWGFVVMDLSSVLVFIDEKPKTAMPWWSKTWNRDTNVGKGGSMLQNKLLLFFDNILGINILARGVSNDLFPSKKENNCYAWLLTPADIAVFRSSCGYSS
nr:zinc finger BED domain-containing protein RICESLEEPER 2-like [Tanacetum cinerariifolium]